MGDKLGKLVPKLLLITPPRSAPLAAPEFFSLERPKSF